MLSLCLRKKRPTNASWNSRQTAVPGCPQGSSVILREMSSLKKTRLSPRSNNVRAPHSTTLLTPRIYWGHPVLLWELYVPFWHLLYSFFYLGFSGVKQLLLKSTPGSGCLWPWWERKSYSPHQGDPVVGGIKPPLHRTVRFEMSRSNEEDYLF